MRKEIIAAASVLALMTGAAMAQTPSKMDSTTNGTAATGSATTAQSGTSTQTPTGGQMASADEMLGKNVYGSDNKKIGEVDDVILDNDGKAKQLVISSGGFLGIGEKQIAVDYDQAKWNAQDEHIQLSTLTQSEVKNMPEFKYSDTMTSLNHRGKSSTTGSGNSAVPPSNTGMGSSSTGTTTTPSGAGKTGE